MNLEDQLRQTLQRKDPSPGFAERVAARAQSGRRLAPERPFLWLRMATAVTLAAAIAFTAGLAWQRSQEERAGRQAVLALRIASAKLNQVRSLALRHTESQ
jgi:hypothetical protein